MQYRLRKLAPKVVGGLSTNKALIWTYPTIDREPLEVELQRFGNPPPKDPVTGTLLTYTVEYDPNLMIDMMVRVVSKNSHSPLTPRTRHVKP